jgi:WhiB family transcriptional regulator, redox-sensing transcriptional regulator
MTAVTTGRGLLWWERAACRGDDTEVFFPGSKGQIGKAAVYPAAVRCITCPVRAECLTEGLQPPPYLRRGIWGGWLFPETQHTAPIDIFHRAGLTPRPRRTPP